MSLLIPGVVGPEELATWPFQKETIRVLEEVFQKSMQVQGRAWLSDRLYVILQSTHTGKC